MSVHEQKPDTESKPEAGAKTRAKAGAEAVTEAGADAGANTGAEEITKYTQKEYCCVVALIVNPILERQVICCIHHQPQLIVGLFVIPTPHKPPDKQRGIAISASKGDKSIPSKPHVISFCEGEETPTFKLHLILVDKEGETKIEMPRKLPEKLGGCFSIVHNHVKIIRENAQAIAILVAPRILAS